MGLKKRHLQECVQISEQRSLPMKILLSPSVSTPVIWWNDAELSVM